MYFFHSKEKRNILHIGIAFSATFFFSSLLQFITLEKVKMAVVASMQDLVPRSLGTTEVLYQAWNSLNWFDFSVGFCLVFLLGYFVYSQIRNRSLTIFFTFILKNERRVYFFIFFMTFFFLKSVLAQGEPFFMDAPTHTSRAWFSYVNFKQGYWFPSFNNYYHNGFAFFSHYGYLFYVIVASVNLILFDIYLSTKIVIMILSLITAYLFYFLGKELFSSKTSALLLTVAVIATNYYFYMLFWTGALFYPLIFLSLALVLLAFEKGCQKKWSFYQAAFVMALGASLLIATHLGYASQILLFCGVYCLARVIFYYRKDLLRMLGMGTLTLVLTAALSAFVFLPTWLDMKDVTFYKSFAFSDPGTYQFWTVPFWQFFVPRFHYTNLDLNYLGLALLVATFVLVIRAYAIRRDKAFYLGLILVLFSVLVMNYKRNVVLLLLAVIFLMIFAYTKIHKERGGELSLFCWLFLALSTDALVFNNFNTYNNNNQFEHDFYRKLALEKDGEKLGVVKANTYHTGNKEGNDVFVSPWLKVVGHKVVQPNALMIEANKQSLYQFNITHDLLIPDIRHKEFSRLTLQGLNLIGVKYLTFHNSSHYFLPEMEETPQIVRKDAGPWLELPYTSPMVFSSCVNNLKDLEESNSVLQYRQTFESDDVSHRSAPFRYREKVSNYVKKVIELTGLNPQTALADQFLIRSGQSESLSSNFKASALEHQIHRFDLDAQKIEIEFSLNQPSFVRVPFAYFPYHTVTLNEKPVDFLPTAMNMIAFKVEQPGRNLLKIGPSLSFARRWGAWISMISLIVLGSLCLIMNLKRTSDDKNMSLLKK